MSSKPNRMAKPRCRHRTLTLPILRHLRYLLLQVLVLPWQVQQLHSHYLFHGGLISYCFSAVLLHHTPMATNTLTVGIAAFRPLLRLCFHLFYTCISFVTFFSAPSILFPCRVTRANPPMRQC
ncbi:hypothetical protein BD769DRAFT_909137 [Suillus cothurnatus]|nr:hypothetical protein BD769DRAFT_909137 [Suillus cothurnatus]